MNESKKAVLTARRLVDLGRWREAAESLGPALGSDETAYEALCLRACCMLNARSDLHILWQGEARRAVESALRLNPHGAWAHLLMATLLLADQRNAAALRAAGTAVRLDPDGVRALRMLARCQLAVCRIDEARVTAEAAVKADPQDPVAHLTVAEVAQARNDWAEAEGAYRNGLRRDPTWPRPPNLVSRCGGCWRRPSRCSARSPEPLAHAFTKGRSRAAC